MSTKRTGGRHTPKATAPGLARSYDLSWSYEPRLVTEHLGRAKYSATTTALGELIANSLDAGATRVDIDTTTNPIGGVVTIQIDDNGRGMTPAELEQRFAVVGVEPASSAGAAARLGRFGVGRLAVHRIGSISEWTTVGSDTRGRRVRSKFTLKSDDKRSFRVEEEVASSNTPTGTSLRVFNLVDDEVDTFFIARIRAELLAQFCSYLLGHPGHAINIQGEALDVESLIAQREVQELRDIPRVDAPVHLHHLMLRRPLDETRVSGRVLFTGKGRTVAAHEAADVPSSNYLGLVESAYLDSIVMSNRESILGMDAGFAGIKDAALQHVAAFAERVRESRKHTFLERAREESFYPFRAVPANAVIEAKRAIFDVVLERVNQHANIEGMSKKQQAVVFKLLNRSLDNEDLLEILHDIAKLSDADIEKFRGVLERTTLASLIKLSSEVTARVEYLKFLHQLVYGDEAAHLKERSQLHKVIEPHCWLFGPAYHLATSDQSFREIIRRHREKAGLAPVSEEELKVVAGAADIPDLFLAARREYPTTPANHHVLVELKAPRVALGWKELEQVRRYAQTILNSTQFDRANTRWDIYLVSSKLTDAIEAERQQEGREFGCVSQYPQMRVWAFSWGELVDRANGEMRLVRQHLEQKSRELSVSKYLQQNFPDVLRTTPGDGGSPAESGSGTDGATRGTAGAT